MIKYAGIFTADTGSGYYLFLFIFNSNRYGLAPTATVVLFTHAVNTILLVAISDTLINNIVESKEEVHLLRTPAFISSVYSDLVFVVY